MPASNGIWQAGLLLAAVTGSFTKRIAFIAFVPQQTRVQAQYMHMARTAATNTFTLAQIIDIDLIVYQGHQISIGVRSYLERVLNSVQVI